LTNNKIKIKLNLMIRYELISPAGDIKKLKYAFAFGADAVYIGGKEFSLRVRAKNFSREDMEEGVRYAHKQDKKVYVTINAYLKNYELQEIEQYLGFLQDIEVDGIIVSDPAMIYIVGKKFPKLTLHLSTQTNITNYLAAKFYHDLGIKRIVLARELSLSEIKEIKKMIPSLELEAFIHGAMCIAYSGRCLLSEYFLRRSANRGDCAQSCRWTYYLMEEKRPGEYLPIFEDEKGTYILSSKDLMTLPILKKLIDAGVKGFKIEGRVKSLHYVSTVTYAYRKALDNISKGNEIGDESYIELEKISHREYWTGFFESQDKFTTTYKHMLRSQAVFTGEVSHIKEDYTFLTVKNTMKVSDTIEFLTPSGVVPYKSPGYFEKWKDDEWQRVEIVHPNDTIRIPVLLSLYTLMRKIKKE